MFEIDGDDTLKESLQIGSGGSYWDIFEAGYETALETLVRPPRVRYRRSQLGPEEFEFGGRTFCRETVELRNAKMQNLESYHWRPLMVEVGFGRGRGKPCRRCCLTRCAHLSFLLVLSGRDRGPLHCLSPEPPRVVDGGTADSARVPRLWL